MAARPCPICRTPVLPAGRKRGDRAGQEFTLSRCPQCGFGFVDSPLTDYAAIYDADYYAGRGADPLVDYAFEFEHPDQSVRRYEWRGWDRMVRRLRPEPGPIAWLDFGCGCGSLVRYLQARTGDEVVGFDTGAWAEKARASGVPVLSEAELAGRDGTFDVVTAIDVIEHVVDPMGFLRRLRRLLQPGGLLIALTQNADIAPRDFAAWSYVRPEIHVSFFTARALAEALRQTGFEPFVPGRLPGWTDLMHSRILKNLRIKRTHPLEACLPWDLLGRLADAKTQMRAMPMGRAR
jgi:SAM-dependent methyltransferase